jgi:hypothetical protein
LPKLYLHKFSTNQSLLILVFSILSLNSIAQIDSTRTTLEFREGEAFVAEEDGQIQLGHDLLIKIPRKAAMYSAVLPGLGQLYNGKYWKLPIVYGAIGAGIYSVTWNQKNYEVFLEAYRIRKNGGIDDYYNILKEEDQLISWMDYYRNNRDLSIILTALAYTLNILDAYVDAHLINFSMSDDLSMKIQPSAFPNLNGNSMYAYGFTMSIDL